MHSLLCIYRKEKHTETESLEVSEKSELNVLRNLQAPI